MLDKNIFSSRIKKIKRVNIYADEVQNCKDSNTGDLWHYIGLIIEDLDFPLLPEIIKLRYCGLKDEKTPYFEKNNITLHWVDTRSIDEQNIYKRWLHYILNPDKKTYNQPSCFEVSPSKKTFYSYVLGINSSKLNPSEFATKNKFCSEYNRFFRTAILGSLKYFFPKKKIIVNNIFHEVGSQEKHEYFPWYSIYKIDKEYRDILFLKNKIEFVGKDTNKNEKSNMLQLCDFILGLNVNVFHGLEKSNRSNYKKPLLDIYLPLCDRLINKPKNKNSSYKYCNRISVSFFPKEKKKVTDFRRYPNQFYKKRPLVYELDSSGQTKFNF